MNPSAASPSGPASSRARPATIARSVSRASRADGTLRTIPVFIGRSRPIPRAGLVRHRSLCCGPVDVAAHLDLALELADRADEITVARFRAHDLVVTTKPDLTPVSEADHAVERAIRDRLADATGHAVLGEEFGTEAGSGSAADAEFRW